MMMKLLKTFDLHSRNQNPKNERKKENLQPGSISGNVNVLINISIYICACCIHCNSYAQHYNKF